MDALRSLSIGGELAGIVSVLDVISFVGSAVGSGRI